MGIKIYDGNQPFGTPPGQAKPGRPGDLMATPQGEHHPARLNCGRNPLRVKYLPRLEFFRTVHVAQVHGSLDLVHRKACQGLA